MGCAPKPHWELRPTPPLYTACAVASPVMGPWGNCPVANKPKCAETNRQHTFQTWYAIVWPTAVAAIETGVIY